MAVAFRQPTFKNPLPALGKFVVTGLMTIFVGMIAMGETAGRARAARELANMGMYDEAKKLMLKGASKDV